MKWPSDSGVHPNLCQDPVFFPFPFRFRAFSAENDGIGNRLTTTPYHLKYGKSSELSILSFQSRICNHWLPFGLWRSPAGLKVAVTARRGICVASPDCQRPWPCYSHGMTASGSRCCCHLLYSLAPDGLLSWPSSSEDGHSKHSDRDTS